MSSLLAVGGGCVDLFATTTEGASTGEPTTGAPVTTTTTTPTTTTTSGEPPGTTTPAPTTTSGEPWTTGTGETSTTGEPPGPPPVQRCQLLPAPDLRDAACAGAPDCRIREAQRLECDGDHSLHRLAEAPAGAAALYVRTEAEPTFGIQHEAFSLTPQGSAPVDIWVTEKPFSGGGKLLPRADGQIELWFQDGQDPPAVHYPPHAEIDGKGYSIADETRDDIDWFIGAWTRPDDVPMAIFTMTDSPGLHALFELPGGRVEQPLIDAEARRVWVHDLGGALKLSWSAHDADLDGTYLFVRDLEAPFDEPGAPLLLLGDDSEYPPASVVLSLFGDGTHAVVLTGDPRLKANAPWTYDEPLVESAVECPTPSCVDGCEAAPACVDSSIQVRELGLQNGPDSVRMWHLECPYDRTLTWVKDTYFDIFCLCDKCRCQAQTQLTVDEPCELVASAVAPDPDAPDTLLRTELWRRTLGFDRADLDIDAIVRDGTLWLLSKATSPTEEIVVWAVDTE